MTYLSETIKPFDVVLVNNNNDKHYYICVYTQELDRNNKLDADIYGVVITSNTKYDYLPYNDYNVPMFINTKKVYINCDKLVRIKLKDNVSKKNINVPEQVRKEIRYHLDKFITEVKTQIAEEVKL
jgi:predicted glycosyl hydrolase (DUF1957 family)